MAKKQFVSVRFSNDEKAGRDREYTYLTDLDLQEGDICVVRVGEEYKVVHVKQVKGLNFAQQSQASKWIVDKVNIEQYKVRMEKQMLAQEIRNKLRARREEYEELMIYQKLAAGDTEINALLQQLETLGEDFKLLPEAKL